MKKILILYGSYGGGHLSAAKSIKQYLETYYQNSEVKLVDCIEYISKYLNKVSTTAYNEMAKKAPWAWKFVYKDSQKGPLSHISSTTNKLMSHRLNTLLQEFRPDMIISTHPFGSHMCAVLKKRGHIHCSIATILTDYAPHPQWLNDHDYIDYFFVAHDEMKKQLMEMGIREFKIFPTGIPLSMRFLNQQNSELIYDELGLEKEKDTVLFFAGGEFGLGRKSTYIMLRALIRLFKDIQVIAISGRNKKMQKRFQEIVDATNSGDRIKVLPFTDKVPEIMSIAKFVITKPGGLTVTECICSHLPILIINPIPGQEEENAAFLEKSGTAIWIKKNDNIARVLKGLYRKPQKLIEMKEHTYLIAKPNSTKDICDIVYHDINQLVDQYSFDRGFKEGRAEACDDYFEKGYLEAKSQIVTLLKSENISGDILEKIEELSEEK